MFGNLFSSAINAVKSFLGGNKAAVAKPAAPKPAANTQPLIKIAPIANLPTIAPIAKFEPYIAKWGDSKATIQAGMVRNDTAAAARQKAQADQEAEFARAAAAKRRYEAEQRFETTKNEWAAKARSSVDQIKKNNQGDFFNTITGGFTGEQKAREFADKQLKFQGDKQVKDYDINFNKFIAEQTKRKAQFEKDKLTMTDEEQNAAIGVFSKWEEEEINNLEFARAAIAGSAEGYDKKATEAGRSPLAKVGAWFQRSVVDPVTANPIFKYTLGSGDQNVPSITTAPGRGINALGNLFNKGDKYMADGSTVKGLEAGKNAWTQSFNQRNFNIAPPRQKTEADKQAYIQKLYKGTYAGKDSFEKWYGARKSKLDKMWTDAVWQDTAVNNVTEFLADPLMFASGGASKVGKGATWLGKAAEKTKVGAKIVENGLKIAESKPVKWLTAEHKDNATRRAEFLQQEAADIKRKNPMVAKAVDDWMKNSGSYRAEAKATIARKVLDDFDHLSRLESQSFQQLFRADGDWSKVKYAEKFDDAGRKKINDLVEKYKTQFDELHAAENKAGVRTPYKRNYLPQYRQKYNLFRVKDMLQKKSSGAPDWWFTKQQTRTSLQKRNSLVKSLAAREYGSKMARQDFPQLQYIKAGRDDIGENIKRMQNVKQEVPKSKWEKAMTPLSVPGKLWKKAVLKYNPAWYVNNVANNIPMSVLAGGVGALPEHARLLRPKNWKAAMDELPDNVKTNIANEIGSRGKLSKFGSRLENWSKMAAYRAAKAKGMTDEAATKRVNKYMFDYKTRNYERPLKTVMPFYQWNKNLARASVQMPFDRPLAAKGYNELDQFQKDSYDKEFQKFVPQLLEQGYTEEEIQKIKADKSKYFKGRLNVGGDNWISTPFNPMSDRGLSSVGFNPYMTSLAEASTAKDSFGNPVYGKDASFMSRVGTKFPQYKLGKKAVGALRVAQGTDKPMKKWIGGAGSEGYGMSKERQGYNPKAANYDPSMDARTGLKKDALAFLGIPGAIKFDGAGMVDQLKLRKVTESYFKLDTKGMDFDQASAARQAIFDKAGMTADEFYKGVLSKYDSDSTKRIKGMKEDARLANKKLFDEYAAQPQGTRNIWATKKLRELNDQNYFADNPFKKSFKYINQTSIKKAEKQEIVQEALRTGDWSKYRAAFGLSQKQKDFAAATSSGDWSAWERKYGRTEKATARDKAMKTGDWTEYADKYGVTKKQTPYQYDGKFFKSAETMAKYKEGQFWQQYAKASKDDRKKLIADNPQFNHRANWTADQWTKQKATDKAALVAKARSWGDFAKKQDANKAAAQISANKFLASRGKVIKVKSAWR